MKRWKKYICIALTLVTTVTLAVGCASNSGGGPAGNDTSGTASGSGSTGSNTQTGYTQTTDDVKRLIFARSEDVLSMDLYNTTLLSNGMVVRQINQTLLFQTAEGELRPWLATKWEASDDATEWMFRLREDVMFSDGTPLTAADVKASYEYPTKNNVASSATWQDLKEVQILGDYEVKVIFNNPCGAMSYMAAGATIYKKDIVDQGPEVMASTSVGTGPWKLKEWNPGDNIVLDRNEYYWGDKPYYDEFEYKVIIEDSTRLAAVQTGAVHIAEGVAAELYDQVERDPRVQLFKLDLADQQWLGLKCDVPPFDNIKAREAVSLCLDRAVFVDMLQGGKVSTSIIPSKSLGGVPDWPDLPYDPVRAKQLLEESGYNGDKIVLLSFTGSYPKTMEQLETVQAMMTAVGFNVSLEVFEMSTFLERRAAEQYNLFWTGTAMIGLDPDSFLSARIVNNTQKCNYFNDALTDAINRGRRANTLEGRQAAYEEAMKIVNKEFAPFIPIYETISAYAISPDVDLSGAANLFRSDRIPNFHLMKGK